MRHSGSLLAMLVLMWLLLSGHYTPLLLVLGALSCGLVLLIARRMEVADSESQPLHMLARLPGYWLWLTGAMIRSNLDVMRIILDPALPISPTMTRTRGDVRSSAGRATLANSITLTPGTLSVRMHADGIEVHALTRDGARDVEAGDTDRRVRAVEGSRP